MCKKMVEFFEQQTATCVYRQYIGAACPGCGIQRAFIELLKGNVWESIKIFPALIPIIFILGYLILHVKFKFHKGHQNLLIMTIFTASLILIDFFVKLINQ